MSTDASLLVGKGWHVWHVDPWLALPSPYRHKFVEIWRTEWDSPRKVEVSTLPPEMNVIGLYWREIQSTP